MGFERVWLPYLYLYGAGGLLFVVGLVMVLRSEAFDRRRRRDRRWLIVLIGGFLWYAALHGGWILAALASARGGA